jgi:hypothetical protein
MSIAMRVADDIMFVLSSMLIHLVWHADWRVARLIRHPYTHYRMMNQSRIDWISSIMHSAYVLMDPYSLRLCKIIYTTR